MTDTMPHIIDGAIDGIVKAYRADAANTPIWAPVVLATAASGYFLPEVGTTATINDATVIGVSVGPLRDANLGYCNTAAGEMINVCVHGHCKVKVDGSGTAIADGDALVSKASAGVAIQPTITFPTTYVAATVKTQALILSACFAMAHEASSASGDIIPCFVHGAMGLIA